AGHRALLDSHRGWDAGAIGVARSLAAALDAACIVTTTSRLLVDVNRPESHRTLFSPIAKGLPHDERERILDEYYRPYWERAVAGVRAAHAGGARAVHLSVHSMTPILDGRVRRADAALLFDPSREFEARFCKDWLRALTAARPDLTFRRNYPYRGTSEGLT